MDQHNAQENNIAETSFEKIQRLRKEAHQKVDANVQERIQKESAENQTKVKDIIKKIEDKNRAVVEKQASIEQKNKEREVLQEEKTTIDEMLNQIHLEIQGDIKQIKIKDTTITNQDIQNSTDFIEIFEEIEKLNQESGRKNTEIETLEQEVLMLDQEITALKIEIDHLTTGNIHLEIPKIIEEITQKNEHEELLEALTIQFQNALPVMHYSPETLEQNVGRYNHQKAEREKIMIGNMWYDIKNGNIENIQQVNLIPSNFNEITNTYGKEIADKALTQALQNSVKIMISDYYKKIDGAENLNNEYSDKNNEAKQNFLINQFEKEQNKQKIRRKINEYITEHGVQRIPRNPLDILRHQETWNKDSKALEFFKTSYEARKPSINNEITGYIHMGSGEPYIIFDSVNSQLQTKRQDLQRVTLTIEELQNSISVNSQKQTVSKWAWSGFTSEDKDIEDLRLKGLLESEYNNLVQTNKNIESIQATIKEYEKLMPSLGYDDIISFSKKIKDAQILTQSHHTPVTQNIDLFIQTGEHVLVTSKIPEELLDLAQNYKELG